jgi:hypothetical protein
MRKCLWLLATGLLFAQDKPILTADHQLAFPADYRRWVFLGSGLGMTYGPLAAEPNQDPLFDNVFVNPASYDAFLKTGHWPDHTIFVLEVRQSASKASINKGGHFQAAVRGVEAEVIDSSLPGGWGFFSLDSKSATAKGIPATASCYTCHRENGAVDRTFVQFYPELLEVAKAKGTLKSSTPHN